MLVTDEAQNRVDVLTQPERLAAVLSPIRRRLLESLQQPDSASGIARKLGLPRQKVNYHLRELERAGFVELDEERQRRGCLERLVRVTARYFVVSSEFLGGLAANPDQMQDRFSSAYLVAAAARLARDVAVLREKANEAQQRLATLALETEVSFSSPAAFRAFSEEVIEAIGGIAAKYNRTDQSNSRRFRILLGAHQAIDRSKGESQTASEETAPLNKVPD